MRTLYQKSEIWFAVVWIVFYVVGASVSDTISSIVGLEKSFTFVFLLTTSLILYFWIKKNGLKQKYGLCLPNNKPKYFLFYIPLVMLILINFCFGISITLNIAESILFVLSMICVGFVEEIIFRGFLFRAIEGNNHKFAILITSISFGMGHIINLFSVGIEGFFPVLCQVLCATAVGFLFVIIFYRGGSLFPCIITHSLINATSLFSNNLSTLNIIISSFIIIIIAIAYSLILIKTLKTESDHL